MNSIPTGAQANKLFHSFIKPSEIIFLIRAYNEAPRIAPVIESILDAGFMHILIVDDGSKDNTLEIL